MTNLRPDATRFIKADIAEPKTHVRTTRMSTVGGSRTHTEVDLGTNHVVESTTVVDGDYRKNRRMDQIEALKGRIETTVHVPGKVSD